MKIPELVKNLTDEQLEVMGEINSVAQKHNLSHPDIIHVYATLIALMTTEKVRLKSKK